MVIFVECWNLHIKSAPLKIGIFQQTNEKKSFEWVSQSLRNSDTSLLYTGRIDQIHLPCHPNMHYRSPALSPYQGNQMYSYFSGLWLFAQRNILLLHFDKKWLNHSIIFRACAQVSGDAFKCHRLKCSSVTVLIHGVHGDQILCPTWLGSSTCSSFPGIKE